MKLDVSGRANGLNSHFVNTEYASDKNQIAGCWATILLVVSLPVVGRISVWTHDMNASYLTENVQ
jgi:hypothetical protein